MSALKLKKQVHQIAYIISIFLFESADLLMLFALPVFIFQSTYSLLATGLIMALRSLGRLIAYAFFKNKLQERNFVFIMLISYALAFLMIILFNRFLSFPVLVLAVLVLGAAREFMSLGILKVEHDKTSFTLGNYRKFLRPAIIFAAFGISLFAIKPVAAHQFFDVQNYYSVLIATSAVFFYYGICKEHSTKKQTLLFPKAQGIFNRDVLSIDLTIFLLASIKAIYWVLFPIYIVGTLEQSSEQIYLLPAFYGPILLLHILKNSFLFKYWKMRPAPKLILFSLVLTGFVLAGDIWHLLLLTTALGLSIGFIEISNWYEKEGADSYARGLISNALGFSMAAILGSFLNTYFTIPSIFFLIGILLLSTTVARTFIISKKPLQTS